MHACSTLVRNANHGGLSRATTVGGHGHRGVCHAPVRNFTFLRLLSLMLQPLPATPLRLLLLLRLLPLIPLLLSLLLRRVVLEPLLLLLRLCFREVSRPRCARLRLHLLCMQACTLVRNANHGGLIQAASAE